MNFTRRNTQTAERMAPTVCKLTQAGKDKTKMRKPAVEKMRRDRINRCIEQLKVLLKAEIKASQHCSKLEKAVVLEMAVIYLKNNNTWPQASSPSADAHAQSYADGFSRCIEETAWFLSVHSQQQITKPVMGPFDGTQQAKVSAQDSCPIASKSTGEQVLWRPW
ncbi:hairy-related 2 [Sinocyclocheilus anshuiensis]|uniref:hairy-related 2 n=1 Tax=Sinocyclocheilus anshuiensis TaxID=1608454 RepID=UPI0007B97DD3|nr:PREDICTED: transcription factor HES-5-like [Sinocyclocheilus anshuiensis]